METYASKLLENGVNELSKLPGIGKKTALRMALYLLAQKKEDVENFGQTIISMRQNIKYCKRCHNISDVELCEICASPKREAGVLCIVSDIRDVLAIENTGFYKGLYHVLSGLISPIEGISPSQLNIHNLIPRIENEAITEIILALPATPDGDTTGFYIAKTLQDTSILVSCIARGIAFGDDLEYTDELTLGRSIANRLPFK